MFDVSHALANGYSDETDSNEIEKGGGNRLMTQYRDDQKSLTSICQLPSGRHGLVVPSLLSSDFGHIVHEARACLIAGAKWLHIDVCDAGSHCPGALTVGAGTVAALRRAVPSLFLDVHVAVDHPEDLISESELLGAMDGAGRITFQLESVKGVEAAKVLAMRIRAAGLHCGICIKPSTAIDDVVQELLGTMYKEKGEEYGDPLIDLVDVLAVNPGFAGQRFNDGILEKVRWLYEHSRVEYIMVDGGVDMRTIKVRS